MENKSSNGIVNFYNKLKKIFQAEKEPVEVDAYFRPPGAGGGSYGSVWGWDSFTGEKNLGGIGPVKEYSLDYDALRARGWETYLTNETAQSIINKAVSWVIGRGLKMQYIPSLVVLNSEGIKITNAQIQELANLIEFKYELYRKSKKSSYSGRKTLNQLEAIAYKNVQNGGDVLVIKRYIDGWIKTELIDGVHIKSPQGGTDFSPTVLANGNRIMNGVEMNEAGEHIAYWVQDAAYKFQRILAKNNGFSVAYLVDGLEYRLDYSRAIPLFSGIFETLAAMDRYKNATLESAEEQNKLSYQIKHGVKSTGENPLIQQIAKASGKDGDKIPVDQQLKEMANKVAVATNKQVVNNVTDSEIVPVGKNEAELYFKDFYNTIFDSVCAAANFPPNVVQSKYDTSFSSARAAIKDWEHTLLIKRDDFSSQFNQPDFEFWLHCEILRNKINLPGYLTAFGNGNDIIIEAFRQTRWVGDNVPHIDPLKEVLAERMKLGDTGASLPLTTHEAATEALNGGDSNTNIQQYANELQTAKQLGIEVKTALKPIDGKDPKAEYKELMQLALRLFDN